MEEWDHAGLIAGCVNCDPLAQKELYLRYAPQMMSLCLRYARDRQDAEDICQQGFYLVYRNIGQVKQAEMLSGWVKTVFVNAALQWNLKHGPWPEEVPGVEQVDEGHLKNDALSALGVAEITKLIQQLPHGSREVFNLYAIEGYSHQEIGDLLQISVGTSKSQLHEARRMLKAKILEQGARRSESNVKQL